MNYFAVISFKLFVLFNSDLFIRSVIVSSITDTSLTSPTCGGSVLVTFLME